MSNIDFEKLRLEVTKNLKSQTAQDNDIGTKYANLIIDISSEVVRDMLIKYDEAKNSN